MTQLTDNQLVQEEQYKFPYHYADLISDRHKFFKFVEMLDLLRLVKEKVNSLDKKMILDAGCGDGRLNYELKSEKYKIVGIDYSKSAISFARAFNPDSEFAVQDLKNIDLPYEFDIIILMEVLEHFIPDQIPLILASLSKVLKADGKLLITVPSKNLKLIDKHYQHFTTGSLAETIKPQFVIEEAIGYSKIGFKRTIFKFLRNAGNLFYPFRKDSSIAKGYFAYYRKYYQRNLATGKPEECNGIMAVCRKVS
jgi:2-polyprenyl-3-methyl-5-hydroxy-6-metoxy-1,4-benzoquinol methylase